MVITAELLLASNNQNKTPASGWSRSALGIRESGIAVSRASVRDLVMMEGRRGEGRRGNRERSTGCHRACRSDKKGSILFLSQSKHKM